MSDQPYNIQVRVPVRAGWLACGESQGNSLDRVMSEMNDDGYKVASVLQDRLSLGARFINFIFMICTLWAWYPKEGQLIIGELIEKPN